MKAIDPVDATHTFGPPKGWDQSKQACGTLKVVRAKWGETDCYFSLWDPSEEERTALLAGLPLLIGVVGDAHPPLVVAVASQDDRVTHPNTRSR